MNKGLLSLLHEIIEDNKEKVAIKFKDNEITYKKLDEESNKIANYIIKEISEIENDIIGIAMPKGINQIIAIIGILKSGKAYLPIDLSYPSERIKYILSNSKVKNIITNGDKIISTDDNLNYLNYNEIKKDLKEKFDFLEPQYAYAMYTSGSTGTPKGNLIKYECASNLINWQINKSQVYQQNYCKTLQLAPISFDVSFQEIFSTLCIGGTIVIVDEITRIDFKKVSEIINNENISRAYMPPVYLNEIANLNCNNDLPYLKEIIVAGEQLKITDTIKKFFKNNKKCKLINQYGPTETHVVTSFTLSDDCNDWEYKPPIGKEIDNVKIYILDDKLKQVPNMEWGELYISGICITGKYLNNEYESKKRYIDFDNNIKIYKTGDICRRREDGIIEYQSRADEQVKIRGYRVEISEIEKNILLNNKIKDCAVIVREDKFSNKVLEAFVSLKLHNKHNTKNIQRDIKEYLKGILPEYMIPNRINILEELPLSPNGKIDKKQLKNSVTNINTTNNKKQDNNIIVELFKEVLGVESLSNDENFFDIGGNSLLANRLIFEINKRLHLNKNVIDIYENPTINKFISSLKNTNKYKNDWKTKEDLNNEDIAIIGMACRLPGADTPEKLWDNIKEKNNNGTKNKSLEGIENFDSELFKISPKEAKMLDPQIRVFLECVWEMFEDSGYNPIKKEMNVGVFAGSGINTYLLYNLKKQIDHDVNMVSSMKNLQILYNNDKDYISTKTSYVFNLTGPSVNVQSACSTSLVAIHLACQSIKNGECDYAIAGASTIVLPNNNQYKYEEGMVYSKDGNCKSFDECATGTVFSNGVGCILLKPLNKAIEDKDNIYAVIKGSAINNDGNNKVGFSAPSVTGQTDVIRKALQNSNIMPEEIEYIEAHGTGTKIGDAIEIRALKNAYITDKRNYCAIGSLKNDIGHMAWSSGLASVIKVVMALKHKKIPPMNNFEKQNPELDLEESPFYINETLKEWNSYNQTRKAGISAFGLGGTNAHIILEEYNNVDNNHITNESKYNLLTLSSKNENSLTELIKKYVEFVKKHDYINWDNFTYTANTGREKMDFKTAVLFKSKTDLIEKLSSSKLKIINNDTKNRKTIFLFSGNGTQYINMGKILYENQYIFRKYVDICEKIFRELTGMSILEKMYGDVECIDDIQISQIAIFTIEYALYNFWLELGIKPDILIGHSLGEYALACVSGIFTIKDCMKILIARGKILKKLGQDVGMISVRLQESEIKKILKEKEIILNVSAVNTKELTVLSGNRAEIYKLSEILKTMNVQQDILNVNTAGHIKALEKYLEEFKTVLNTIEFKSSDIEIISTVTGKKGASQLEDKEYWCKHLTQPVRFAEAIENLKNNTKDIIIEIGANPILLGLAMEELNSDNLWIVSLRKEKDDLQQILYSISQLYLNNVELNLDKLYKDCKKISLPTYKFKKDKYWFDYENKNDLSVNFYSKKMIEKQITIDKTSMDKKWIIFYQKNNKEIADKVKELIGKNVILIELGLENNTTNPNKLFLNIEKLDENLLLKNIQKNKYNVLYFLEYFNVFEKQLIDIDTISNKNMKLVNVLNILINNEILENFYCIDVQNNKIIDNNIIRNMAISLLQVARLENSNTNIKLVMINDNSNAENIIIKELKNTSDDMVLYTDNKRYIYAIHRNSDVSYKSNCILDKDGIYIITGGLGGIGKIVTKWIAKKNVNKIILLNRRIPSIEEIDEIHKIEKENNIVIDIKKTDINSYDELEKFIYNMGEEKNNVKGIFHLAGVINDATINKISFEQMKEVLLPKIVGSWNLHILSKKHFRNLQIFNLFSSAAAFIGNAGQVNHAIANSFLDSMVEIRKNEGLPVNSINWGTWEKIGHLAQSRDVMERLTRKGFKAISTELGLDSLECILNNNIEHIAVLPMNWEKYVKYYGLENKNLFMEVYETENIQNNNSKLQSVTKEVLIDNIDEYIKNTIEDILGINSIKDDDSLIKLGLDSLSSIEIRNKIQSDLKIQLEANFIYRNPTLKDISNSIENSIKDRKISSVKDGNPSYQQRRWLKLIEKNYGERVIPIVYELPFNEEYFIESLKKVLQRHVSLRWYFPDSKIKELEIDEIIKINQPIIYNFENIDRKNEKISEIIMKMFKNMPSPYERTSWSIKVINLEKEKFAILLGVQHLDFDGSSVSTFAREFKHVYYKLMNNENIKFSDEVIGYDKYIKWQNNYIENSMKFDSEYFKGLYGIGKITLLPNMDKNQLGVPRIAKKITQTKDDLYIKRIDKLSEKMNVSRFSIILAGYVKFISELINEDVITIATIINGRSNTEFKNTIGPFSAPFPLKLYASSRISNMELIEQCNNQIIEINSRSFYPVSKLREIIPAYKELPIETYFSDIGINYTNYKPKNEKQQNDKYKVIEILTQVQEEEFQVFNQITFKRVPGLHLVINELKDKIAFNFYYHTERFDEKTVNNWKNRFFELLEDLIKETNI